MYGLEQKCKGVVLEVTYFIITHLIFLFYFMQLSFKAHEMLFQFLAIQPSTTINAAFQPTSTMLNQHLC